VCCYKELNPFIAANEKLSINWKAFLFNLYLISVDFSKKNKSFYGFLLTLQVIKIAYYQQLKNKYFFWFIIPVNIQHVFPGNSTKR
jgi:hypothetical protein